MKKRLTSFTRNEIDIAMQTARQEKTTEFASFEKRMERWPLLKDVYVEMEADEGFTLGSNEMHDLGRFIERLNKAYNNNGRSIVLSKEYDGDDISFEFKTHRTETSFEWNRRTERAIQHEVFTAGEAIKREMEAHNFSLKSYLALKSKFEDQN